MIRNDFAKADAIILNDVFKINDSIRGDFTKADTAINKHVAAIDKSVQEIIEDALSAGGVVQSELNILADKINKGDDAIRSDFTKVDTALKADIKTLKESDEAIRNDFAKADTAINKHVAAIDKSVQEIIENVFNAGGVVQSELNIVAGKINKADIEIRSDFATADKNLKAELVGEFKVADAELYAQLALLVINVTNDITQNFVSKVEYNTLIDRLFKAETTLARHPLGDDLTDFLAKGDSKSLEEILLQDSGFKQNHALSVNHMEAQPVSINSAEFDLM